MNECDVGDIVENKKTGQLNIVTGVINDRRVYYYINELTGHEDHASFDTVGKHWQLKEE